MNDNEKIKNIEGLCKSALYCKLGSFYPDKNFGSKIRQAIDDKKLLLSFVRSALNDIDAVYVKSADLKENKLTATLLINDEERQVSVDL